MKGACKKNLMATSVIYYQSISAVLANVMAQNCLLAMTEKLKKRDKKSILASVQQIYQKP